MLVLVALLVACAYAQEDAGPTFESITSGLVLGAVFGILVAVGGVVMCFQCRADPLKRDAPFEWICCQPKAASERESDVRLEEVAIDSLSPEEEEEEDQDQDESVMEWSEV